jgi:HEAT repeat protein
MRWIHGGLILAALAAVGTPGMAQRAEARITSERLAEVRAAMAPQLARLDAQRTQLGMQALELRARAARLAPAAASLAADAPESWLQGDPGDSLYRLARASLNRGRYRDASRQFHDLRQRYPKSGYVPDAMYWEAFALYREGGSDRLRQAGAVLDEQQSHFPEAATAGDASTLAVRIRGELARLGDNDAAEAVAVTASQAAEAPVAEARAARDMARSAERGARVTGGVARGVARGVGVGRGQSECNGDDESDMKIAALNALLQMDADKAVPILKQVLARRDSGSVCLRRKAIFLVSQKQTDGTEEILLDAARSDPDPEVKQQAVFWLSQVGTEKAVSALDSILRRSTDPELQDKAVFALAQHGGERATAALRTYAEREDVPEEMREKAVFWLGQTGGADNATFLRTMYGRSKNKDLKQKILFSLSQTGGKENQQFLLDIARNKAEDIDARKQALFWAGQSGAVATADLSSLYSTMPDQEMREQIIFVLSQRGDAAAMDKLIDIARHDQNPDLRKRALFWVGQSKDPRATQLLQDILNDK